MVWVWFHYFNGLVQERRNSSALAMELRLTCTNPSISCAECIHNSWKMRICLSDTVNIMAADDLATQAARASAAMLLMTYISRIFSVPKGLKAKSSMMIHVQYAWPNMLTVCFVLLCFVLVGLTHYVLTTVAGAIGRFSGAWWYIHHIT